MVRMSAEKGEKSVEYVRYWADGQTRYCLLQWTDNEDVIRAIQKRLAEVKSVSTIDLESKITKEEAKALHKWASESYVVFSGRIAFDPAKNQYAGQEDHDYVTIKHFFTGIPTWL